MEAISIEVENRADLTEEQVRSIRGTLEDFPEVSGTDEWMIDSTETWCRKAGNLQCSDGVCNHR